MEPMRWNNADPNPGARPQTSVFRGDKGLDVANQNRASGGGRKMFLTSPYIDQGDSAQNPVSEMIRRYFASWEYPWPDGKVENMSRTIAAGKVRMSLRLLLLSVCLALLILPTKGRTAPKPAGTQQVDQKAPSSCPVTIGRKSPISSAEFFGSGSAHW